MKLRRCFFLRSFVCNGILHPAYQAFSFVIRKLFVQVNLQCLFNGFASAHTITYGFLFNSRRQPFFKIFSAHLTSPSFFQNGNPAIIKLNSFENIFFLQCRRFFYLEFNSFFRHFGMDSKLRTMRLPRKANFIIAIQSQQIAITIYFPMIICCPISRSFFFKKPIG